MIEDEKYEDTRVKLSDREWRLDNLYWIIDEGGNKVKFVRNEAQKAYWSAIWFLNLILKARQLGFSTFIEILQLDMCLFNTNTTCGLVDYTMDDARAKITKIKFCYENLLPTLKSQIKLTTDNSDAIGFSNGSLIVAGTSHVGGTLQSLHVSEIGKTAAENPEKAREIRRGSFGTVHARQMIHVESTPRGTDGLFYDMVQIAEKQQKEKRPLSELDFKLHFFPWWMHKAYRLAPNKVLITLEDDEYFAELEAKHGVKLDLFQRSWYVGKKAQIGADDIKSEYPSTIEECFQTSIKGAFFKRELTKARVDGRIGLALPHDPTRRVNTFWDIGEDCTAIWFHQTDGVRHRLIDYYENYGEGLQHYATILKQKSQAEKDGGRSFNYGIHYGPHDLDNREWSAESKPRVDIAAELGIKFEVVPRIKHKEDSIEAARRFLGMAWFCAKHTARGVSVLDNYRKQWNDRLGTWRAEPLHDWASHGADSLQCGAVGLKPDAVETDSPRARMNQSGGRVTAWSA